MQFPPNPPLLRAGALTGVSQVRRTIITSGTCCSESPTPACPTHPRRPCVCQCRRRLPRRARPRFVVVTTAWLRSPAQARLRLQVVASSAQAVAASLPTVPSFALAVGNRARCSRGVSERPELEAEVRVSERAETKIGVTIATINFGTISAGSVATGGRRSLTPVHGSWSTYRNDGERKV